MLKHFGFIALAMVLLFGGVSNTYAQSDGAQQTWTVNFKDSDIQEVIKFIADVTGKTVVIDPRVKGRVKVISNRPLNEPELLDLFRSVLEVHDFTLVQVGDIVRIVPLKDARSSPLPVVKDESTSSEKGYVTQVIQLQNIAAAKVLPVLRPLVPQHSHLAAYDPSNAIVVSDTVDNIERLIKVIQKIDKAALPTTEIIQLKYADATDLVATLTKLDRGDKQASARSNSLQIVADKRNNAVLLSGEDLQRQRTRELIQRLDRAQPQTGNVRVVYLEYAKSKDVAAVLSKVVQNMSKLKPGDGNSKDPGATVEADEDTNSLLITASGDMLNSLLGVIQRLDIRRAQVLIEAIIVEISATERDQLGVDWLFSNELEGVFGGIAGGGSGIGGVAGALLGGTGNGTGTGGTGGASSTAQLGSALVGSSGIRLGAAGDVGAEKFVVLLAALRQSTKTNILSTPTLMTMDNNEATISVGQNVPFVTGSFTNSGGTGSTNPFQTIQREDVGISLTVTPQVNEGDKVLLDLSQEVSSLSAAVEGSSDLITNQSTITTQILAEDGEIVVLGGLTKQDVQDGETRVPYLGRIPILGNFFKSEQTELNKSNLLVFLRAKIIRDDSTMNFATAEKYKFIRDLQMKQKKQGTRRLNRKILPVLPELEEVRDLAPAEE